MGTIKIVLPDEIEQLFRMVAMKRFGYQKGSMSEAAKEAISGWMNYSKEPELEEENFWDSLEGTMKNIKKSSVELQHEAKDYISKRYKNKEKI